MSVTGASGIGIPVILLHDAEGGFVTVELKNGFSYRGILDESQDNFNCTIKDCTKIDPQGGEIKLDMAFVRGSQIKFIIVPEMLKLAPYFRRISAWRKYKGNPIVGAGDIARNRSNMGTGGRNQKSYLGKGDSGNIGGAIPPPRLGLQPRLYSHITPGFAAPLRGTGVVPHSSGPLFSAAAGMAFGPPPHNFPSGVSEAPGIPPRNLPMPNSNSSTK